MTEGDRLAGYCGQCGNPVQPGDRFCGTCGAAVLPPAPQAEQVIPQPAAPAQGGATRSGRRPLLLTGVVIALLVLMAGGVALAFAGLGADNNLFGGSGRGAPSASDPKVAPPRPETGRESTSLEPTTFTSPPSGPSSSEEAQLEQFGREYDTAARSEGWEATYAMLHESSQ